MSATGGAGARPSGAMPLGFWDFSVKTYGKPGVAEACLILQNRWA